MDEKWCYGFESFNSLGKDFATTHGITTYHDKTHGPTLPDAGSSTKIYNQKQIIYYSQ